MDIPQINGKVINKTEYNFIYGEWEDSIKYIKIILSVILQSLLKKVNLEVQ